MMMATNDPGIFLDNFGVMIISNMLISPIPRDQMFVVPKLWK